MISLSFSSFRDEIIKISMSLDADTRNNMALRHEIPDFLLEGRLEANDEKETNFIPKLGAKDLTVPFTKKEKKLKVPTTKRELQKTYRKARKPAMAAAKGALYASLIANIVSGGRAKQGYLAYSTPATIGAGAGLADYIAQGKMRKKNIRLRKQRMKKKLAMISGSETFTPGRALTQSRNTASFQDNLIHKGSRLKPPTLGNKFKIPDATGTVDA